MLYSRIPTSTKDGEATLIQSHRFFFSSDFCLQRVLYWGFPKDWDLESLEKRREHLIDRTENTEQSYECNAMKWFCLRACSGTSRSKVSGGIPESSAGHKQRSLSINKYNTYILISS